MKANMQLQVEVECTLAHLLVAIASALVIVTDTKIPISTGPPT